MACKGAWIEDYLQFKQLYWVWIKFFLPSFQGLVNSQVKFCEFLENWCISRICKNLICFVSKVSFCHSWSIFVIMNSFYLLPCKFELILVLKFLHQSFAICQSKKAYIIRNFFLRSTGLGALPIIWSTVLGSGNSSNEVIWLNSLTVLLLQISARADCISGCSCLARTKTSVFKLSGNLS